VILDTIRLAYPDLTRNQQRIADYISHAYHQVVFMTASQLADHLGMNEATVIRFAQRLGYRGYPQLVAAIQEMVQRELSVVPDGEAAGPASALVILADELETAARLVRSLPAELLDRAAVLLAEARRTYVIGQGVGDALGALLCAGLQQIGCAAMRVPVETQALAGLLQELTKDDVLVCIAMERERTPLPSATLRLAALSGMTTIAIACEALAPCAQAAELALICPRPDPSRPAYAVVAALIDALLRAVSALDPERERQRQARLEETAALLHAQE